MCAVGFSQTVAAGLRRFSLFALPLRAALLPLHTIVGCFVLLLSSIRAVFPHAPPECVSKFKGGALWEIPPANWQDYYLIYSCFATIKSYELSKNKHLQGICF